MSTVQLSKLFSSRAT